MLSRVGGRADGNRGCPAWRAHRSRTATARPASSSSGAGRAEKTAEPSKRRRRRRAPGTNRRLRGLENEPDIMTPGFRFVRDLRPRDSARRQTSAAGMDTPGTRKGECAEPPRADRETGRIEHFIGAAFTRSRACRVAEPRRQRTLSRNGQHRRRLHQRAPPIATITPSRLPKLVDRAEEDPSRFCPRLRSSTTASARAAVVFDGQPASAAPAVRRGRRSNPRPSELRAMSAEQRREGRPPPRNRLSASPQWPRAFPRPRCRSSSPRKCR